MLGTVPALQFEGDGLQSILSLSWVFLILAMFVYGQRIQVFLTLRRSKGKLDKLERMMKTSRLKFIETMSKYSTGKEEIEKRVDALLDFFVINPVGLDPKGIVGKVEHLLNTSETVMKDEVRRLAPQADVHRVNSLSNLLEVSLGLTNMYRIVRHFYISGKKMGSMLATMQLQLVLPMIMDSADAHYSSLNAFSEGLTIGDGLGPMVASKLAGSAPKKEIALETSVSEAGVDGRHLLIISATGPGGTVGRPGEAIQKTIETYARPEMIITVDAALRLEGERSGEVVEGIGAAIGGPGVDRYKIEQVATEKGIPLEAFVVKMSEKEAISQMGPELEKSVDKVIARLRRAIGERTKVGDTILLAGIGNAQGVK